MDRSALPVIRSCCCWLDIELSIAVVYWLPGDGIEIAFIQPALTRDQDEAPVNEFFLRFVELIRGVPAPLLHKAPGRTKITVIRPFVLRCNINQKFGGPWGQRTEALAVENCVVQTQKRAGVAASLGPGTLLILTLHPPNPVLLVLPYRVAGVVVLKPLYL